MSYMGKLWSKGEPFSGNAPYSGLYGEALVKKGHISQGVLPIVAYMERLCLKGVPVSGVQKGRDFTS